MQPSEGIRHDEIRHRKPLDPLDRSHALRAPGVWLYQLTDKGLALELTAKGTKYSKDDDLN